MPVRRQLILPFVGVFLLATVPAPRTIAADGGNDMPAGTERNSGSELAGDWRLVRTRNPQGGADAVSIMRTADISRSDIDLAGLMIRCSKEDTEIVVVLIRPFSVHARPVVVLGKPNNEIRFRASVAQPGTAILLPKDAISLVRGPWQTLSELSIEVIDGSSAIRGIVALAGLPAAFKQLVANCPDQ